MTTDRKLRWGIIGPGGIAQAFRDGVKNSKTGELVAILEDRSVPWPDWASAFASAHTHVTAGAIGGGIDNGHDGTLNWAVFFCDFGRYRPPFTPGPRNWISDVNICYKRRAVEMTRAAWRDRYHETTVHWALTSAGETLYLSDAPMVDQMRGPLRLGSLIRERFAWGRVFAYTRARERSIGARLLYAMATPFLPALLYVRHFARHACLNAAGLVVRAGSLASLGVEFRIRIGIHRDFEPADHHLLPTLVTPFHFLGGVGVGRVVRRVIEVCGAVDAGALGQDFRVL